MLNSLLKVCLLAALLQAKKKKKKEKEKNVDTRKRVSISRLATCGPFVDVGENYFLQAHNAHVQNADIMLI